MRLIVRSLIPFAFPVLGIIVLTFGQVIGDLLLPNFMATIVDKGIAGKDTGLILHSSIIMLSIALAGMLCAVSAGYLASKTALAVGRNLRTSLFSHVTNYSLSEFDRLGTSSLITRTTNDVQQIQNTTFMFLRMLLRTPLMCIGSIVMAVEKDRGLSLILLSVLPVVIIIILLVTRVATPLFRQMQGRLDELNLVLRENLVGIRIVRAFSRIGFEKRRFAAANSALTTTSVKVNRIMAVLNPSMMLSMNLLTIAIIWFASFRIAAGSLLIGDMMAFIQYAMQLFMSLMMFTMMFVMLPRALASAERINEVFAMTPRLKDPEEPTEWVGQKGHLVFDHVTFRYDHAEKPAVDTVSFTAAPGEVVAIIGGTGAGKSALVNLIPRFYDVEEGAISVDGVDVRDMCQEELRDRIGFVPQKAVLFSGTVSDNIRIGNLDATDAEIHHACEVAQAADFIDRLPDGYDSVVAQGGTNLSGGQKQRLSIARALVRKPEIYVFDDSFSALDFKTDAALQQALRNETRESTVLIVAQRVTSIVHANKIIVMDKGAVVGMGTHGGLLKSNEVYKEIVFSQLSEDEIA